MVLVGGVIIGGTFPLPGMNEETTVAFDDPPAARAQQDTPAQDETDDEADDAPDAREEAPATTSQPPRPAFRPDTPSWIVVINSIEPERGRRVAVRKSGRYGDMGLRTHVLNSTDYGSLNPGYWVVYAGPFGNEDAAAVHCRAIRSRVGNCYQRFLDR